MIIGRELVEKMYSENYDEYENTRLYSTGDSDLDELLERAFCDGYEYAQREFSNKYSKKIGHEIGKYVSRQGGNFSVSPFAPEKNALYIAKKIKREQLPSETSPKDMTEGTIRYLREHLKK